MQKLAFDMWFDCRILIFSFFNFFFFFLHEFEAPALFSTSCIMSVFLSFFHFLFLSFFLSHFLSFFLSLFLSFFLSFYLSFGFLFPLPARDEFRVSHFRPFASFICFRGLKKDNSFFFFSLFLFRTSSPLKEERKRKEKREKKNCFPDKKQRRKKGETERQKKQDEKMKTFLTWSFLLLSLPPSRIFTRGFDYPSVGMSVCHSVCLSLRLFACRSVGPLVIPQIVSRSSFSKGENRGFQRNEQ